MTDFYPNPTASYIQSGSFEKLYRQILIEQQKIQKFELLLNKHWAMIIKLSDTLLQRIERALSWLYQRMERNKEKIMLELPA